MVEIDKLGVIFESKGAEKIIADLTNIQNKITELNKTFALGSEGLKKYQQAFDTIGKSQKGLWEKITREIKTYSKEITKSYDEEIEKLEKIKKLREEAYKGGSNNSASDGNSGYNNRKNLDIVYSILSTVKFLTASRKTAEEKRQETLRRYNQENLIGSSSSRSVGYDIALSRYGGIRGEGLESLRNFSVGLGAATRGDISLLRTLGKWGIGGINPQDDPLNVAKAIAQRSKGLSKNERLALFADVGFTDAQAMAAEKGDWGMFQKSGNPISISEVVREASESYAKSTQTIVDTLDKFNSTIGPFTMMMDEFIEMMPELSIAIAALAGASPLLLGLFKGGAGSAWGSIGTALGATAGPIIGTAVKSSLALALGGYLGWSIAGWQKDITSWLHKKNYLLPKDGTSDIDSAAKKAETIKSEDRGYFKRNWYNILGAFQGLPYQWDMLIPNSVKNYYNKTGVNPFSEGDNFNGLMNHSLFSNLGKTNSYYPIPTDLHTSSWLKPSNHITINIDGSKNAYEIGEEVIRVLEQTTGY